MSAYLLEVMTPERLFFRGEVVSLRINGTDGELAVLKGHTSMLAGIDVGDLYLRLPNDEQKMAVHAKGFLEVRPDRVLVFVQSCEWPEEIDVRRAERAKERAMEKLRQKQSLYEHRHTEISLARAMTRLRISSNPNRFNQ